MLAFVLLAVGYSLATPPLEAGDESRHYAVIKYMAQTGRLPVQNVAETRQYQRHWSHEGNQPPLYYGLAALLTGWIDTGSWDEVFWYNPHTTIGNPLRLDNKNITIHPPAEGRPWRGHVLAVHLARFLSIGMAAVTVVTAYLIALRLFRRNRWLACGAMAITAFNPMFIFISAAVNNDNAVIMFITLALWLMVRLVDNEAALRPTPDAGKNILDKVISDPLQAALLLGLLIGLGALSKLYAFGLLPLAGLLLLWLAYRREADRSLDPESGVKDHLSRVRFWRNVLLWNGALGLVFLALAGWFYLRNATLYDGDIFGLQVMREAAGQRREAVSLATLRAEFEGFRIAYWALFGGVNILVSGWIYALLDWLTLIALVGLLLFIIRFIAYHRPIPLPFRPTRPIFQISPAAFVILFGWTLIMLSGFVLWNLTQPAGQGRLLYPAIAAISALGMLGLSWWLPPPGQKIAAALCIAGLFSFAAVVPVVYIAPIYAKPPILTEAELPHDLQRVGYTYESAIRLIGLKIHAKTVRPAERLPLTLYWEILKPPEQDYSIFIHLLGRQRDVIGQLDSYPGGGKWPTSLLNPGDILADDYEVPITPEAEFSHAPARLQIAAGIYDFFEPGRPGRAAIDAAGQPVDPIIGSLKLVPWQWPAPDRMAHPVNFSGKATLLSYHLARDQHTITFNWQATAQFEANYTVFIQALNILDGSYATGFDGPPIQGDYPTMLWSPGEVIVDTHRLGLETVPAGQYRLVAGLYNPVTGDRLPAFGPDGPLPDYAVDLGTIQVPE